MGFINSGFFKYLKNLIIGVAAALIMIGAYLKITHHELADLFLMLGLFTEAGIFLLLGLLPPHKEYYWEKMYPNLDKYSRKKPVLGFEGAAAAAAPNKKEALTAELDKMLTDANINQDAINRLGDSLHKLGDNVNQMTEVTNTAAATHEYTASAKEAAAALASVKDAYSSAAAAAGNLNIATEDTQKYHEQVQLVSKNLSALNAVYELELQDTNNHLKSMNKFYGTLSQSLDSLSDSVDDAQKYKEQIGQLANNLSRLNTVYGNMLGAMQVRD